VKFPFTSAVRVGYARVIIVILQKFSSLSWKVWSSSWQQLWRSTTAR